MHYSRRQERYEVTGTGKLTWDSGTGSEECSVVVRNINSKGVQVVASSALEPGSVAYLSGDEFECLGDVRYCRSTVEGFLVGLSFRQDPFFRNSVADSPVEACAVPAGV